MGVTSRDWFHQQGAAAMERGVSRETKEKYLRSYILNNYENHLAEIFLAVNNEYSEWDQVSRTEELCCSFVGLFDAQSQRAAAEQ